MKSFDGNILLPKPGTSTPHEPPMFHVETLPDPNDPGELENDNTGSDEIPERMYTDSEVVGYQDKQLQIDTYNYALMGNLPITGQTTICEIGAKRGDLARYISETYTGLELTYIGFETNDLLCEVGKRLFERENLVDNCDIVNADYMRYNDIPVTDITIMPSHLIYNPNITDSNKWSYCEQLLRRVIPNTLERVIFTGLHIDGGDPSYISLPVPNMVELLLKFNHPFKIDFGRLSDMYTVVIDTTTKRFLI